MSILNRARIEAPRVEIRRDAPFFNRVQGTAFEVRAADSVAEIDLYDEIGFWGVTAADFRAELRRVTASTIRLRVNSPGGDVFDGIAMFNDLLDHPARVEVEVTGLAASAASVVAMAGDQVDMADNAFLMIHNAWALAIGNRHDMRDLADVLEKIDGALAATYADRSGADQAEIAAMMDAETWLTAAEAVEAGLADDTSGESAVAATFDLSVFGRAPKEISAAPRGGPATKRDFERALREAGASKTVAAAMVAGGFQAVRTRRDAGDDQMGAFIESCETLLDTIERAKP